MQKQKFSVKVDASLVNQLTLSLREAEREGERILLGVENARERVNRVWPQVSEARREVKGAVERLSVLSPAARDDYALAALLQPLEDWLRAARGELDALEASHDEESRILKGLEGKADTNRSLQTALEAALALCEAEE